MIAVLWTIPEQSGNKPGVWNELLIANLTLSARDSNVNRPPRQPVRDSFRKPEAPAASFRRRQNGSNQRGGPAGTLGMMESLVTWESIALFPHPCRILQLGRSKHAGLRVIHTVSISPASHSRSMSSLKVDGDSLFILVTAPWCSTNLLRRSLWLGPHQIPDCCETRPKYPEISNVISAESIAARRPTTSTHVDTMHLSLLALPVSVGIRATQALLQTVSADNLAADLSWDDFSAVPGANATGHFIFDTVNSPRTGSIRGIAMVRAMSRILARRHVTLCAGHNIIPGTVPAGTLLYHGRPDSNVPRVPDWTATGSEHAYHLCGLPPDNATITGCCQLTFAATRPLKVLYFDGSSTANMEEWGNDGYAGVGAGAAPGFDVSELIDFEIVRAGSSHNRYPGETRIALDLSRLISFYDTDLVPPLIPYHASLERRDHRVHNISAPDLRALTARLHAVLLDSAASTGKRCTVWWSTDTQSASSSSTPSST
ncbi:hypothetical protein B0H17DRAFT_1147906 [Mycena rosella]|uniref:Uncharacterized protein n=1 Tax=Mycena rosella TaxID=1033263 RepID=A0AAD7CH92_MYCRO|nr:hypothetical protein B0H17DRAFT_1147906 [Mycena rosella]